MVAPSPSQLSPHQLWQAALGELQMLVAGPVYENFLKGTVGAGREGDTLTVAAPSDFVLGWLDVKLRPLLTQTVQRLAGEPLSLRFTVLGAVEPVPGSESRVPGSEPPNAPFDQPVRSPNPEPGTRNPELRLNVAYTFATFVVGKSNQLAHGAAQAVAAAPGQHYNPLFLSGG